MVEVTNVKKIFDLQLWSEELYEGPKKVSNVKWDKESCMFVHHFSYETDEYDCLGIADHFDDEQPENKQFLKYRVLFTPEEDTGRVRLFNLGDYYRISSENIGPRSYILMKGLPGNPVFTLSLDEFGGFDKPLHTTPVIPGISPMAIPRVYTSHNHYLCFPLVYQDNVVVEVEKYVLRGSFRQTFTKQIEEADIYYHSHLDTLGSKGKKDFIARPSIKSKLL